MTSTTFNDISTSNMIKIEFKYLRAQKFYKSLNIISHFLVSSTLFKTTKVNVREGSSKKLDVKSISEKNVNVINELLDT